MTRYHLSRREDKTTETDDIAIAAEPIQGCSTRPTGRKTPADKVVAFSFTSHPLTPLEMSVIFRPREYGIVSQRPTGSYGNADQVVDERKHEVDSDPLHRLFREVDASNHIQKVIL